ncbi:MAG: hypothetical protein ACUVTZ_13105 [Armatimonadota bacterium]
MKIHNLTGTISEDDLNWLLGMLVRPGSAVKQIAVTLVPGKVLVSLSGDIPLIGDRSIHAELVPSVHDDKVHLTLTHLDIPLVPRALVCRWIASQAAVDYLSSAGNDLVVDVQLLLKKVRLDARITGIEVQHGTVVLSANHSC